MTEREALKLALEALEKYAHDFGSSDLSVKAMYVVRQALVQPEQKPVGLLHIGKAGEILNWHFYQQQAEGTLDIYTTPPQRTWVGLTEQDRMEISDKLGLMDVAWLDLMEAIEAKLKEKNT